MLKIWKRTWKEKADSARKSQSGQDSDQEAQLSGTSSSAPNLDAAEAALPTGDPLLVPVVPPGHSRTKRSRKGLESEPPAGFVSDRPLKKTKQDQTSIPDSLGNHLPEVTEDDQSGVSSLPSFINFSEQVLDQAKCENTIAVLPPLRSVGRILVQFLKWAVEVERSRPNPTIIRYRTALFVVDDERSVDKYAVQFEAENGGLIIGKYSESIHGAAVNPWPDILQKDVVIVTAILLLDSLLRGTLAITQLHVLMISDAQNIKDQDSHALIPIVKVMNDFYRVTDPLSRPRIFAMAIADRGFHFDSGMIKLENTLDAKVFGISAEKRAEILALPDRPNEVVVMYDVPVRATETKLFKQLHRLDPSEAIFRHHFKASRHALAEVGACASDLVWRRALKEIEATVPPWYEEDDDLQAQAGTSVSIADAKRIRDIVKNWDFTMPNLDSSSRGFNVTPKFLRLVQILKSCEPYGEGFRGIVFVQRRAIALVIADLLRTLDEQLGFLRPYTVIGCGPSMSTQPQQEVFRSFATGTYNLLIATKSAEDLDIPKASIVIRFDLFESQVSHAYARARTRGRESHLVHLVERSNDVHRRILSQITQLGSDMLRWTESLCNTPRSSIPPHTLRETINPYHSDSEDDDDQLQEFVKDPTTSGRIYLQDATTVIYRFASSLGIKGGRTFSHQPLFDFKDEQREFGVSRSYVCTVLLPGSPVDKISGSPSSSMAHARRSACYHACVELFKIGLLDYRLFPLSPGITAQYDQDTNIGSQSVILDPTNNETFSPHGSSDNKSQGTRCYPRKQPDFWPNTGSVTIASLYPTIISTDHSDEAMQPHAPILILTRQPLPSLSNTKLFFSGVPAIVRFRPGASFKVDERRLHDIYMYTIRMCRAIANKPFVCSLVHMHYFFAPLGLDWTPPDDDEKDQWGFPNVVDHIPWELVTRAAGSWAMPLKYGKAEEVAEDIEDAVIQDRWVEFTRRYDVIRTRPDLTPLSKPLDSPREADYDNLVEYCKSRRKGFEGLQDYGQALVEVSKIPAVLNRLNPTSRPLTASSKSPAKYLIPELCAKFTIPASTLRTALLLPSITRRIDDFLVVKELNAKFFDHAISEDLLHMAISAASAGVEYDYERLELLGDAFLKYLSSIYVFVTNPAQNEGALHVARQRIISNKSLLQNASRAGLPLFIQAKPFTFKSWQPPNFHVIATPRHPKPDETRRLDVEDTRTKDDMKMLDNNELPQRPESKSHVAPVEATEPLPDLASGTPLPKVPTAHPQADITMQDTNANPGRPTEDKKPKKKNKKKRQQDEQDSHSLGDKAVADVAEAIIGAAYISGGRETALKVTKALNIPIPNIDRWSDFGRKVLAPPPNITAKLRPGSIEAVEAIIGHKFNRPHLLAQALTHASIQGFESTSYERLEFIGDAILDFMIIRHIFDRDQQLSPGGLTLLKGAMVSNSALAAVCVWSGLQEHLLLESYHLASSIQVYADQLKDKQTAEYEAAERDGRSPGQYWLEIEPPKALSDVVESVIGAIYISDNFSPVGAEALFDNVLKPFYDQHVTLKTLSHHPTKILFELFQAQGCQQFEITKDKDGEATRCHVLVHDVILASAQDSTATIAARRACLFALDALEGDAAFLTRTCDCRSVQMKRAHKKKALENFFSGFAEEDEVDILTVEGVLAETDDGRSESLSL